MVKAYIYVTLNIVIYAKFKLDCLDNWNIKQLPPKVLLNMLNPPIPYMLLFISKFSEHIDWNKNPPTWWENMHYI